MEWIRIEDALPHYDQEVMVYKAYHDKIEIARRISTDNIGENWSCGYQYHITHWSVMPEPPKDF